MNKRKCFILCVVSIFLSLICVYFRVAPRSATLVKSSFQKAVTFSQQSETKPEMIDRSTLPLCSKTPPNLRSHVSPEERWKAYEDDPSVLHNVQTGGTYQPRDCRAREHVAVVTPYRDRKDHLHKFLVHIHQFLQKQQLEYTIFIAEMAQGPIFNTGLMQNVGFMMANNRTNFTCFIIHDIDLMPTNENNLYRCDDKYAIHIATNNSKNKYKPYYQGYFGGVIALRRHMYQKANGFSNLYFGWGDQDNDFRARVQKAGIPVREIPMNIGVYEAIPHERDAMNPPGENRGRFAQTARKRASMEGLNTLQYKMLKHERRDLYTWALAEVNRTQVMQKFEEWRG